MRKIRNPGKHGVRTGHKAQAIRKSLEAIRAMRTAEYRKANPAKEQDMSWVQSVPTGLEGQ